MPFVAQLGWRIERFAAGDIAVRLPYSELLLRPGGTICGPALMALADVTPWPGALDDRPGRARGHHEPERALPQPTRAKDVIAEGRILKLGRRLAVGEVTMRSDGDPRPICHVTGTYAIPPDVD